MHDISILASGIADKESFMPYELLGFGYDSLALSAKFISK